MVLSNTQVCVHLAGPDIYLVHGKVLRLLCEVLIGIGVCAAVSQSCIMGKWRQNQQEVVRRQNVTMIIKIVEIAEGYSMQCNRQAKGRSFLESND